MHVKLDSASKLGNREPTHLEFRALDLETSHLGRDQSAMQQPYKNDWLQPDFFSNQKSVGNQI